jgi:8-oxo-dGTP diphosphatase
MAREEQAVFTVLVLVTDPNGQILVEDRVDESWKGLCLPGGHVEKDESFTEAAIRETLEETGLMIESPRLCGVKQFQTKDNARYVVFFYVADQFTGTLRASEEGEVFWVDRKDLAGYPLVEDFMDMIKVMESPNLSEFYYYEKSGSWGLKLL